MKPFRELQIVEIAGSQAGAFTAKMFADYGASVVRVEPPGGDPLRQNGEPWNGMGTEFAYFNTSKRSICLDLATEPGMHELGRLMTLADAVIESSAPNPLTPVSGELGDDHLVRVYLSPFGLSGPYARYRSNVFTDDAVGGHMALSGEPDREPIRRAGLHTHFQAGMHGFIGSMSALLARERTGRGQTVEVSHFEGMAALHQHTTSMWTHGGHIIRREGNAQPGVWHPAGVYPCKDGYVFLGHSSGGKLIPFVEVLGYGHLFDDPRFATDGARGANKRAFDEALIPRLMELTVAEITEFGRAVFSPIGPVPTMLEVLDDEQFTARDFWATLVGDPPLKVPRGPFIIGGHAPTPVAPPGRPGTADVDEILAGWTKSNRELPSEFPVDGPLYGVRVLDLTRVWSGPIAGRLLADLGADVIHVESPWNRGLQVRDVSVAALSHLYPDDDGGERQWNRSGGFNKLARNKRAVTLNLQDERGRSVFAELVRHADVVLENYSPRVMPQLGFGFADLQRLNPSIVYTAISGYGSTGPGQNRVALGPVIEAAVGLTAMMGYWDSGPYRSGVAWADPVAGMSAVGGTLVGLWDRAASGSQPQRVEVAMSEAMATFVGEELLAVQVRGTNAPRLGNRDLKHAPQGAYRCAGEDRWLAISVTSDDEWRALCEVAALGSSLAALSVSERHKRHDEIDQEITAWTQAQSPWRATDRLQSSGVIATPVSDGRDLVEDPHLDIRGFWAEMDHPDVGRRRYPGSPIKLSETPGTYRFPPPGLGEHNQDVYVGLLGMSGEDLAALIAARVVVEVPPAAMDEMTAV
ncbi:MAG: hypothetical protein C0506_10735 [Anaerolinea sp.]|nr:hypothetical protein [Anaerolinea sp.]